VTHRPPAVAGLFYPDRPDDLRASLARAFADAVRPDPDALPPKAIIVPHAGYVYSGSVAASAYLRLGPSRATISRVVVLGPSHRVYLNGLAVPSHDLFDTPLGAIPIDVDLRSRVQHVPGVVIDDEPHRQEHSLEVQLPFLQTVLDEFRLLPFSVGDATASQVAAALEIVWGGAETLVVISTDLSHYEPYETARQLDARTAAAIVAGGTIGDRDACGARPLRGLLKVVDERHMAVEQLDLRNSGDTAGDRNRVVGYGSFAVR
jgi:AmmeMemoRadiSam system protein B